MKPGAQITRSKTRLGIAVLANLHDANALTFLWMKLQ
jgi:hypothetical protein